ncbi:MAG: Nicotinate dehydrogenase small FeS subunit [Syntrophorhabdaceae bacterium PtaU1.Bin034]|nr:MAG: Nicotinate dehydrogenase small FeS subunit [Syntrophorhabdaceae bacterium PtaU1.Bin034]
MKTAISFVLNGNQHTHMVEATEILVDFIRDSLGLTGTKVGCGIGECGACTVLVDGEPVNACLVLAVTIDGKTLMTVEGLADGNGSAIQKAFVEAGAVQCGYCTPGMLLSAKALLDKNPVPTEEEIRKAISGNLCRCTGYEKIIRAVEIAARSREDR